MGSTAETIAWCTDRGHPLVTWSPWAEETLCRCGAVRLAGEHPVDWEAKRQIFHDHPDGERCICYTRRD